MYALLPSSLTNIDRITCYGQTTSPVAYNNKSISKHSDLLKDNLHHAAKSSNPSDIDLKLRLTSLEQRIHAQGLQLHEHEGRIRA